MYRAVEERYSAIQYRRCGNSGIDLPLISLGLWHNFGGHDQPENMRKMLFKAFDHGITHFDLANNYGPPYGSAEENFGRIMKSDLVPYRDELIISTKAGWDMWPGPYGDHGSRKYLIASLDQSLKRLGLEYVDIFYHHRPDPDTPLEETMSALDHIVRSGRALYVGISQYDHEETLLAKRILEGLGTRLLIHQPRYNMMDRWIEPHLLPLLEAEGVGCIVFSPLAQGILTNRYLKGIPAGSRASRADSYLSASRINPDLRKKIRALQEIALERGESLAQMSIHWVLKRPGITSALIGASSPEQIQELLRDGPGEEFSVEQLQRINSILGEAT